MNILLVDFWNVINSTGGTEKVLCNMANEFVNRNYKVAIMCCDPNEGKPFFFLNEKVEFINLNGTGKEYKGSSLLRIERELLRVLGKLDKDKFHAKTKYNNNVKNIIKKTILKLEPNVIIVFDPYSLICFEYLIKPEIPIIAMLHMNAESFFNEQMSKTLLEAFRNVSCIQTLTKKDVDIVKKFLPESKVVYIPNIVFENSTVRNQINNVVINVGRIDEKQKRQLDLIKAFNLLDKRKYKKWTLELVGGTAEKSQESYKSKIINYIKNNNLSNRVKLLGEIKNVSEKLQEADIFAFPSAFEGMPLALTEAMAAGLPAIGYKSCPSVNELIVDGVNGFLCEDGIDDFAEKLKILMQDAVLRKKMGQNARESMKQFAPEKIWDEWEDLINKVVEESKK